MTNLIASSLGNLENGFINMVFLQMVVLSFPMDSGIWYFLSDKGLFELNPKFKWLIWCLFQEGNISPQWLK